ncbi:MAG TPA: DUF815 domain-containing protein [Chloroflexota bacterium]|nr:DUF815 domain-containing protein [Chloroflexota bacterium]
MDGVITSEPPAGELTAELAAALDSAEGLLLFAEVLANPPGRAYVRLLRLLVHGGEPATVRRQAAELFTSLADAVSDGLAGPDDAWQRYLVQKIRLADNPFSRAAQQHDYAEIPAGLRQAARHDLAALGQLYRLNGARIARAIRRALESPPDWHDLNDLGPDRPESELGNHFAAAAATDAWDEFLATLAAHYRDHGVGRFAEYHAFRWHRQNDRGVLRPVRRPDPITFDDLIGYAEQRRVVRQNTEHFLAGLPAQNLLLYGERGTGKSSTVKALLHAYAGRGLRLIEVAKSALNDFPEIVEVLADRRERFILFVDDLSFDAHETGYKELKALLEGSVEARPENILVYATSNRRHLIQECFGDRALPDDDLHAQDTLQEKLSLADRFGQTVIFLAPDQEQYLEIVTGLAERRRLPIELAQLRRRALQWATWNNGRSGRTARQFVDELTAELGLSEPGRVDR